MLGAIRRFSEDIDLSFDRADSVIRATVIQRRRASARSRRINSLKP
ncbi:hypothetical protein [Rhizobium sp. P28RR-XV]